MKKEKEKKETPIVEDSQLNNEALNEEIEVLKKSLDEKTKECTDYVDQLKRLAAEFDNFRKRTAREKETVYGDAVADTAEGLLPVLDNLERALVAQSDDATKLKEGVEMVLKQLKASFETIGIEEIASVGAEFDPSLHNAVMHEESDEHGQNVVIEQFQKGFKYKDKIIRHSMVKVVN